MQMENAYLTESPEHGLHAAKETEKSVRSLRAAAGKALLIFFVLMAALTLANRALNELAIAEVDAVNPQRGALEKRVDASGQLRAVGVIPVYAEASVHVDQVHVRAGQMVAAGDPLFTLEADGLAEFLAEKKKTLDEAQRTLDDAQQAFIYAKADMRADSLDRYANAQAKVERAQTAYDQAVAEGAADWRVKNRLEDLEKAIRARDRLNSVRSYFDAEKDLEKAGQEFEEATEEWEKASRIAQNPTIYAPCDAQVVGVDVEPGGTATTDAAAVKLARLDDELELVVAVSEDDAENLETGDMADITIGNRDYQCPILSIAPSSQEAGKTELSFRLPAGAGRSGMSADVQIRKRTQNYDLLIPLSALRKDNTSYYVYMVVQRDGALGAETTVARAEVSLLDQDSTRAAVQGGVGLRDQVVARGDRELHDGDRVRVKEE